MSSGKVTLLVASLGSLALALRALLGAPPPTWVAVLCLGLYLGVVVVGVLVPRLEMFGAVAWRGEPEARGVALSFDDGPSPRTTPRVLATLKEYGVTATFFVIGEKAAAHPELLAQMLSEGHTIGVHGHRHRRLYSLLPPAAVTEDLRAARAAVELTAGVRPRWFRPPVGQVSPRTAAASRRLGLVLVGWSCAARDGLGTRDDDAVLERLRRGLRRGGLLALHDAAEREDFEPASVRVLPRLLEVAQELRLPVVPLEELIEERAYD